MANAMLAVPGPNDNAGCKGRIETRASNRLRGFFYSEPMTHADESAHPAASSVTQAAARTASKAFAAAVNHVLARESWARERLKPYAGKTARLALSPFSLLLMVQPDGLIAAVDETEARTFDVTLSVPAEAAPGVPARRSGGCDVTRPHRRRRGVRDHDRQAGRTSALGARRRSGARDWRRSGSSHRLDSTQGGRTSAPLWAEPA